MVNTRIDWVDYAKGFCIIAVVMMHSTLGVEKAAGAEGWLHAVVDFARPFRMPDFFLIAGLFLARVIDRNWRDYLDRKVVHFAYFYVLWLTIQFAFKAPGIVAQGGVDAAVSSYLMAYLSPFGTMWFIYMLPIFFVVTKLTRSLPWWTVGGVAAVLHVLPLETGWYIGDQFAERFVFFYTGYAFAPLIFRIAAWAKESWLEATALILVWANINGWLVFSHLGEHSMADLPGINLMLGMFGAVAVVTVSALLSNLRWMSVLRYCGQNSIVIYLGFFLPMAVARVILLKFAPFLDLGTISLIVTAAGVIGPLVLFWMVRNTWFRWLFERPAWARLGPPRRREVAVPAE
ncbi:MAG: acyltransferase [Hyphomicrobiales bacterium]|nr:MAG: acyltransferase [Hyphomicrobiales bacterium]